MEKKSFNSKPVDMDSASENISLKQARKHDKTIFSNTRKYTHKFNWNSCYLKKIGKENNTDRAKNRYVFDSDRGLVFHRESKY